MYSTPPSTLTHWPNAKRLSEIPDRIKKAAIKRASKSARAKMRRLDRQQLRELEALYRDAVDDIGSYLAARAADDNTLRLEVMRSLHDQAQARLATLAAQRNNMLNSGLFQAADLGAQVFVDIGVNTARIADEAVRVAAQFIADDGLNLSGRIWNLDNHADEVIKNQIQRSIIQGHSASQAAQELLARGASIPPEMAKAMSASQWQRIHRNIKQGLLTGKGSVYYNAKRVMRTELNRAHGEAYMASAFESDEVIGTRFLLSPNHPRPDICDMHASVNRYGLGPGVYPEGKNPWPAHPNTLSFVEVVFADEVTEDDRTGKEDRISWLKRQDAARAASVLGSKSKYSALQQGVLRESEINTPWKVLKKKYQRRGIDITGAVPGSKGAGVSVPPVDDDIIIKTTLPDDFPVAETLHQANKNAKKYVTQSRAYHYIKDDDGEFTVRFRHGPRYLPNQVRTKKYNKVSFSGLDIDTANAAVRALHELDQVAEKLGIPAIRGVNTSAGSAAASMGDGILSISKYNNRLFSPGMSSAEAIIHYKAQIERKQKALAVFIEKAAGHTQHTIDRVTARYQEDISNLQSRIRQLEKGVSVDEVTNPPSRWVPGSSETVPGSASDFFSHRPDKFMKTMWHEFAHHIHQQIGATNRQLYLNPQLEADLAKLFARPGRVYPGLYSMKNHKEWFAESYGLYRMGRSDLVDKDLLELIYKIERGEYTA